MTLPERRVKVRRRTVDQKGIQNEKDCHCPGRGGSFDLVAAILCCSELNRGEEHGYRKNVPGAGREPGRISRDW